ncbi:acetyltransferase [Levilactobacillus suantsaii]|uniref:Acetyltransferase n=1 Tax=Levilactobacillus suantsaii TaxID=2292255 RepID=A0A4Q0VMJ6_9LACO|nr:acetyltransferase [Levilactobacillus suantsaii]QMU07067.1 acetyltransferase [Levilactobacillus suantsaii]RXI80156.1 acetyltransferase [Levilactobacillus suantsaii]
MTIRETPGQLTAVVADFPVASLHYLVLNSQQWVLEQLFVRPQQPVDLAQELIERFSQLATTAQVTVKVLDPYAKRYFSQHPAPDLLAAHQLPVTGPAAVQPVALTQHPTEEE